MITKKERAVRDLEDALSENGIVCLHAIDQPLVTNMCDIIGILHRKLEAFGMSGEEIAKMVEDES